MPVSAPRERGENFPGAGRFIRRPGWAAHEDPAPAQSIARVLNVVGTADSQARDRGIRSSSTHAGTKCGFIPGLVVLNKSHAEFVWARLNRNAKFHRLSRSR